MEALTAAAAGDGAFVVELPYPPSVNHYWRRVGDRTLISREGRKFRKRVCARLERRTAEPMSGRVAVHVTAHPPDRRRRDLDNAMKALLDALGHGGVYEDDGQIDRLEIERGPVVPGGKVVVRVSVLPGERDDDRR
ncbi:MAG: RusA family crossover junction endodeoxyribonuclease [Planctomycetota bacterium]|nr:RusA family crossover junction endodeoxyribonuclease [bacterium]